MKYSDTKIVTLCGGVGGSKLAYGLNSILDPDNLTIIANTGDDFVHLGFYICPDIDTIIYTLADLNDSEKGWGRKEESWRTMEILGQLGADTWFQLGDKDLALHLYRSKAYRAGSSLTSITKDISEKLGVQAHVLPMSNEMIQTIVDTDKGKFLFQEYFVKNKSEPIIRGISFKSKSASITSEVRDVMADSNQKGFIICPSNPYLSIDPSLSIKEFKKSIIDFKSPKIAISPIVNRNSMKGPTSKIMEEIGIEVSSVSVAEHYKGLIDGIIIDESDKEQADKIKEMGIEVKLSKIIVKTKEEKNRLARESIEFIQEIAS